MRFAMPATLALMLAALAGGTAAHAGERDDAGACGPCGITPYGVAG